MFVDAWNILGCFGMLHVPGFIEGPFRDTKCWLTFEKALMKGRKNSALDLNGSL